MNATHMNTWVYTFNHSFSFDGWGPGFSFCEGQSCKRKRRVSEGCPSSLPWRYLPPSVPPSSPYVPPLSSSLPLCDLLSSAIIDSLFCIVILSGFPCYPSVPQVMGQNFPTCFTRTSHCSGSTTHLMNSPCLQAWCSTGPTLLIMVTQMESMTPQ